MDKYDVIVIGGGIGGLTCALLLAKKGVRVAVFEKEHQPGGYCSSFLASGYMFDTCIDSIGGLRKTESLRHILEDELGVLSKLDVYELNPIRRNIFPDMIIDVPADVIQYREMLKTMFPAEKKGIDKIFYLMEEIYISSIRSMCDNITSELLTGMLSKSYYDVLSSCISDRKLRAALSSYCTFLGLPAQEVSVIAASNIQMHYVKGGTFRFRGGMHKLSNALADELIVCGGKIFLNEEVTEIVCDNGYAVGVVTKKCGRIYAGNIVSNIDIKTALSLMENCSLKKEKLKKVQDLEISGSFVIVYLGIKDDLCGYDFAPSVGHFSSYNLNSMLNKNKQIAFGFSIPSALDISLAPPGCSTVVIHWPFCYNYSMYAEIDKDDIGRILIEELSKTIPHLKESIAYQSIAGPSTLQRYTGNRLGAAYGWKQSANLFENLPLLRKIVKNFNIVGHWAGYGGGVMPSMLSAYRVAKDITR